MNEELSQGLNRYYFLVNTLKSVIDSIEEEMKDSKQWFLVCPKIAYKFHIHTTSFVFNLTQDLINIQIDEINISSQMDISNLYTNIRLQLDTYSTFYHIFMHEGSWDEKIVRFRLWELDSLICRQTFSHNRVPEKMRQIEDEKKQILEVYNIIESFSFFKDLSIQQKNKLVKIDEEGKIRSANWKFDKLLITSGKKIKYSWEELARNTGIKSEVYSDMHSFTSMHVHSNYISILQNIQLTDEDKHAIRMVGIMLSSYLISLFLDDLCNKFGSAQNYICSMSDNDIEIIKSFIRSGREKNKIKYFVDK